MYVPYRLLHALMNLDQTWHVYFYSPETNTGVVSYLKTIARGQNGGEVDVKSCFFWQIWPKLGTFILHPQKTNTGVVSFRKTNPHSQTGGGEVVDAKSCFFYFTSVFISVELNQSLETCTCHPSCKHNKTAII